MGTLLTILVTIGGILAAVASIITTLYACGKDILNCLRTMCKKEDIEGQTNKKEDIEKVWTSPTANEMKPKMNPPQSSSSLRNVSRDSLVEGSLMTLLRDRLKFDPKNSVSILSGHVDHFHSNKSEDAVLGWGCGLRSIQMLSSHLLSQRHETREVLYGGSRLVPDIALLQTWLEKAREKGFGPTHDSDRGFSKNESRIGAKDCAALLRSFGLRANVVDFESTSSSFVQKGHHVLTEWVWDYFSDKKVDRSGGGRRVIVSEKAPLYFDYDGHSRTIVGIQATLDHSNGMQLFNLLIFHPHKETKSLEELLRNKGWQQQIKRGIHTLKEPPYQLCYVDPGIARGKDLEDLKTIKSIPPEF